MTINQAIGFGTYKNQSTSQNAVHKVPIGRESICYLIAPSVQGNIFTESFAFLKSTKHEFEENWRR